MSDFCIGDVVVARVTAQGMTKGKRYLVVDAITEPTFVPGGVCVTYVLQPGDDKFLPSEESRALRVINLHVLADKVEQPKPRKARKVRKVRVLKPKWNPDDEQWEVVVKVDGERCEARTYYTDDRADALGTYAAMCQEAGQAPHGKRKASGCPTCNSTATVLDEDGASVCESCGRMETERTYRWATDAASGTVTAKSIKHAIRKLIADGEWSTGAQERRYIADGSWLRIDGCLVRGGC